MRKLVIFLMFGGLLAAFAPPAAFGQETAHAPEPAKTRMVFMTDHGTGIVLSVSRSDGFVILEGPADHVAQVRAALVRSGLPCGSIIARPVDLLQ
ncbi:MAG: hypothetical protein HYZ40_00760 [Rhodospirillales bacterium]|nr:hypothetical protein [Rhodospirillales bacterium]